MHILSAFGSGVAAGVFLLEDDPGGGVTRPLPPKGGDLLLDILAPMPSASCACECLRNGLIEKALPMKEIRLLGELESLEKTEERLLVCMRL
mmetsp:Transcript_43410/g.76029  ORF Transcript_43410/g.76029 Transcript_43410/m.76029 type:complete len:92 (-) Transcript_43410:151-426(-)